MGLRFGLLEVTDDSAHTVNIDADDLTNLQLRDTRKTELND
jgi:hypothetical protein